jgi:hypothetical protein
MTFERTVSLPTEILHEVALYLSRHVLNLKLLLLFQPHPLGQVASDLFFSVLTLHFGIRILPTWLMFTNDISWNGELVPANDLLTKWHEKRSNEILTTIINDAAFAKKIRRSKLYALGDLDELAPQLG